MSFFSFLKNNLKKEYVKFLSSQYENKIKKVQRGINLKKRKPEVIISLTSYPERFPYLYITLCSLLLQEEKPDKIILYLCKEEVKRESIPYKILALEEKGVEIRFVDKNLKPYNKLIHALYDFPEEIIITCDDDIIYPSFLTKYLLLSYQREPNVVTGYRCYFMKKEKEREFSLYSKWKKCRINLPHYNIFPTGVGGVLYPPKILHKEVFNENIFTKICPLADDIWFKAMSLLNEKKSMMALERCREFPVIPASQDKALYKINIDRNFNDEQLKAVFDYYDLYKLIE